MKLAQYRQGERRRAGDEKNLKIAASEKRVRAGRSLYRVTSTWGNCVIKEKTADKNSLHPYNLHHSACFVSDLRRLHTTLIVERRGRVVGQEGGKCLKCTLKPALIPRRPQTGRQVCSRREKDVLCERNTGCVVLSSCLKAGAEVFLSACRTHQPAHLRR